MKTSVLIYSTIISFFRIVQMLPIHMFSATNCYFRYFFGEFCFNLCFGSQSKPLIFLVSSEDPLAFAFSNVLATAPPSELICFLFFLVSLLPQKVCPFGTFVQVCPCIRSTSQVLQKT